jgi:hypothetical protein
MHSSHAAFIFREEHRQELLSFAEQQRLVKLACAGAPSVKPHAATAMAIRAFVHGLTAFMPLAQREQRSTGPASTAVDSPQPFIAPRS